MRIHDRIVCLQCEAVHTAKRLNPGEVAQCVRCAAPLARHHHIGLAGLLALSLGGLIVLVIANTNPIVALNLRGYRNEVTLWDALVIMWTAGEYSVALITGFTVLVAPAALLASRIYLVGPMVLGHVPPGASVVLRVLATVQRWSMVEVFMLGALVALVRLASMATLIPGPGLIGFAALTLLISAVESGGLHRLWDWVDHLDARRSAI